MLVPQGDRPFSFVVYSSEIRDFGLNESDEYEYARVGEEVDDVERRSGDDSYEILHTITIIEVQVDI